MLMSDYYKRSPLGKWFPCFKTTANDLALATGPCADRKKGHPSHNYYKKYIKIKYTLNLHTVS